MVNIGRYTSPMDPMGRNPYAMVLVSLRIQDCPEISFAEGIGTWKIP